MYTIHFTATFKKDYKRAKKRGLDLLRLKSVIEMLAAGKDLDPKLRDHSLSGNWSGFRECHLNPDWLLIYKIDGDRLVLVLARTGSHADLFSK